MERFGPVRVLEIEGCSVGLAPEAPELGTPSPETAGATTVRLSLHVADPDAVAARAVAAGATLLFPVADQDYGMRQGQIVDPFGHHWLIGTRLKQKEPPEGGSFEKKSAATYSPGRLPSEYHRPWQA